MAKKGIQKYIPDYYYESIFDIDFLPFYKKGIRLIFLDIDNTIAKYTKKTPSKEIIDLVNDLKEVGFEIIVISNNYKKRIKRFCYPLDLKFVYYALKPLKMGYRRGLRLTNENYQRNEIIAIGDQLMTDIKGANKMGFYTILVNPLERKTDVITTKINRIFERRRINKIKNLYPKIYETKLKKYDEM